MLTTQNNPEQKRDFIADFRLESFLTEEMGFEIAHLDLKSLVNNAYKNNAHFDSFTDFASAISSMVSVHETYFLRHKEHFNWIESIWLDEIIEKKISSNATEINILSAGCSTGEEPYSIYAHIQPTIEKLNLKLNIDALDVSQNALDHAQKGWYSLWSLRGVNIENENDWLDVKSRIVTVKEWVKKGVNFFQHNLNHPLLSANFKKYDLILCRNVMIYMHEKSIENVYSNLSNLLEKDGFLIPGPSDPNPSEKTDLALEWYDGVRIYRKKLKEIERTYNPSKIQVHKIKTRSHSKTNETYDIDCSQDFYFIEELIRNCEYEKAKKILLSNIMIDPIDVRSNILLSQLALELGDTALAGKTARNAIFLDPDSAYTNYIMANYKKEIGDEATMLKILEQTIHTLENNNPLSPVKYCESLTNHEFKNAIYSGMKGYL